MKLLNDDGLVLKSLSEHHVSEISNGDFALVPCEIIAVTKRYAEENLAIKISIALKNLLNSAILSNKKEPLAVEINGKKDKVEFFVVRKSTFDAISRMTKALLDDNKFNLIKSHKLNIIIPLKGAW